MKTSCIISLKGVCIAEVKWLNESLAEVQGAHVRLHDRHRTLAFAQEGRCNNVKAIFVDAYKLLLQSGLPAKKLSQYENRDLKSSYHLQEIGGVDIYWFGSRSPINNDRVSVVCFMQMCLVILLTRKSKNESEEEDPLFEFSLPDGNLLTFTRHGISDSTLPNLPDVDVTHEFIL